MTYKYFYDTKTGRGKIDIIWRVTDTEGEGVYRNDSGAWNECSHSVTTAYFQKDAMTDYCELSQTEANDICRSWGHSFNYKRQTHSRYR